ncbi:MAG: hypothetical protein ACRD3W_03390, partial [Terriglobales bacterium]
LGCVLYEMSLRAMFERCDRDDHNPIPAAICEIVSRALEPDPARRYQTVAQLRHAVVEAFTSQLQQQAQINVATFDAVRHCNAFATGLAIAAAAGVAAIIFELSRMLV